MGKSIALRLDAQTDAQLEALSQALGYSREMAAVYATDGGELAKGVLMMKKQSAEIMAKLKIEVIDPTGEQFDPTYHNAILHEEDEESPENTVKETLQKGYRIGDRVIRYALVKVVN